MSRPTREQRCELRPGTNWPLVLGAATAVALGAVAAVALSTESAPKPAEGRRAAAVLPPVPTAQPEQDLGARLAQGDQDITRSLPELPEPRSEAEAVLVADLLASSRVVSLEREEGTAARLVAAHQKRLESGRRGSEVELVRSLSKEVAALLAGRDDLRGLPLLAGRACLTDRKLADVLEEVSRAFRRERTTEISWVARFLEDRSDPELLVRPFEQICQAETVQGRRDLVQALSDISCKQAKQALARRAVFDPCPDVRTLAVKGLAPWDRDDAREVFLAALRHPWAPAANHAALALVALKDRDAVGHLRELLEQPDPSAPARGEDGKWRQRELVRVNHLSNCLLCHPPSMNPEDPARGVVPTPGQPLPTLYYDSSPKGSLLVRADVTYFRQDFSVMHRVEKPAKWPEVQRFDYLVQTRELSAEARAAQEQAAEAGSYPQREAVRWALAKFAGEPLRKEAKPVVDRRR